jgi:hypothetical protein
VGNARLKMKEELYIDGGKYVGEFKDGKRNGTGTYTFPDGEKYVGEFKDDKYNGTGTSTFPSGQKYVGEFKDGKKNGTGTLTFPDGEKYVGEFKDDKYVGNNTLMEINELGESQQNVANINTYYLFFDTETTGLPRNWKAPVTDLDNWPRMIQIAWVLCDNKGNYIESDDYIIMPERFKIPIDASKVHGISTERAIREGEDLTRVLNMFNRLVERSDFIVAHNISFDEKIVGAEFIRKSIRSVLNKKRKICTMESSTNYCKIPGPYGYKWPKLSELHIKLFGKDFDEAHDASVDIEATVKCFWEMRKRGLV